MSLVAFDRKTKTTSIATAGLVTARNEARSGGYMHGAVLPSRNSSALETASTEQKTIIGGVRRRKISHAMTARGGASIAHLPIYPYYCRGLSATLGRWCPVTARDVHALEQVDDFAGQDVYFYKNHMIKYVRLTGVIVAVDEFPGRMVYTLDDSSGVNIEVTCTAPPKLPQTEGENVGALDAANSNVKLASKSATGKPLNAEPQALISPDGPDLTKIDVGSVVKVKGGIGVFRQQKQIRLKIITILGDTNAEVKCWNDMMNFRRDVLSKPWVVTAEEEEKCRLEVDREARWRIEEEAKRKKDELRRHLKQKARELREETRKVKDGEGKSTGGDEVVNRRRVKDKQGEGLDPMNRVNYPSKAARRRAAGKYDALGI